MPSPKDYNVGWICAVKPEYVAATEFLEDEHPRPESFSPNDTNDYTLGRIGKNNVVIAVLPTGGYGMSSAVNVATHLLHSFPNVKVCLMVGIAGGAPSEKHDIRLGDVVVSEPRDDKGGVVQYDFGKILQGQGFQITGFLNQPPTMLLSALMGIQVRYEREGHRLKEHIAAILKNKPRLQPKYQRPPPETDRLFKSDVIHDPGGCAKFCASKTTHLVPRRQRGEHEDDPAIHYGLIASGNQLMKDASIRDKISKEHDILCFEMEAAGLMNNFPCLVIRGICDYSDSHKNDEWQGYAAMAAAAFAKDLLTRRWLSSVASEQLHITDLAKAKRLEVEQKERQECHQLFRLTTTTKGTTYEWYKDRVEERIEETCLWFLEHHHFELWLGQDSGTLLVTADPGSGKSVLAKYLIDHGLPRSSAICYFFFKDQDQNTVRQALCAVLHQVFSQTPSLLGYAISEYRKNGTGFIDSTNTLWRILRNALSDTQTRPTIIVFDALDECAESDMLELVQSVSSHIHAAQASHSKVKYLLTCRPYERIVSEFHRVAGAFPHVRIPGEDQSEAISQEVNHVIAHRVKQLSKVKNLPLKVQNRLLQLLQEATHRTYIWVYLVFNYLEDEPFKKTVQGIESTMALLPRSINEAYDEILHKSKNFFMARQALSIILAASRPLTLSEMNIALSMEYTSKLPIDLEDQENFKLCLRNWCGLLVTIHKSQVYFLDETAREFLVADSSPKGVITRGLNWHRCIERKKAHKMLAEACVLYLCLFEFYVRTNGTREPGEFHCEAFFGYSANNWGMHFREADIRDDDPIIPFTLRLYNLLLQNNTAWFRNYFYYTGSEQPRGCTALMLAARYGHRALIQLLLDKGAAINAKDLTYGRTPLHWAAMNSAPEVISVLLEHGAAIDASDDNFSRTPLMCAIGNRDEVTIRLLLERGADLEAKDKEGCAPILQATNMGCEAIVKLLLASKASVNAQDSQGRTSLSLAAKNGNLAVAELLVATGADIEGVASPAKHRCGGRLKKDMSLLGGTPLLWALMKGHKAIAELIVRHGTDFTAIDKKSGRPPLSWAAEKGYEAVVKSLVDKGANVEVKDLHTDDTALSWAKKKKHKAIVKFLLEKGAGSRGKQRCVVAQARRQSRKNG
ncbi:hypothetical protein NQ176_g5148 [Zarea fungicola]|uniref:Uncharacterized protein n=1 Tax=Zarea fungicola TaxID=93591 RepID=A0ACC1N9W6_9HYPO|nr:hypothetical protein NQ176_g5148 [Lecanicillium fungicola]